MNQEELAAINTARAQKLRKLVSVLGNEPRSNTMFCEAHKAIMELL